MRPSEPVAPIALCGGLGGSIPLRQVISVSSVANRTGLSKCDENLFAIAADRNGDMGWRHS
jgi:hypothetical protein